MHSYPPYKSGVGSASATSTADLDIAKNREESSNVQDGTQDSIFICANKQCGINSIPPI
jgi:hypothetical protein